MNILYIVKSLSVVEPQGAMQISAMTRAAGHAGQLAVIDELDIPARIDELGIDLVAMSLMSTEARAFREAAQAIKDHRPDLPIVAGGPHPTYFPTIARDWPIDAAIIGEGDQAMLDVVEAWEQGRDFDHIPNVHTKERQNPPRALVEDLDTLPWVDRELVAGFEPFRSVPMKSFMATRGCPYGCAYCFNNAYKSLYRGLGKMVRRRSVENLVQEIEAVKAAYPLSFVRFGDDVFVAKDDAWLEEFVAKYKERVGLPFYCLIRPNLVSEAIVGKLRDAGCHSVAISLESGNEDLRRTVLNRAIDDQTMLKAYDILRSHGLKIFSNAMLGLPESTIEDDLRSLEMTFRLKPTYASFTVFTPFPGTELHRLCVDKGYVEGEFDENTYPESTFQSSSLNSVSDKDRRVHRNILMLGALANSAPWLRSLIFKRLIYWRPNPLFAVFGFFVRNMLQRKVWPFRLPPWRALRLAWRVYRIDRRNYRKRGVA